MKKGVFSRFFGGLSRLFGSPDKVMRFKVKKQPLDATTYRYINPNKRNEEESWKPQPSVYSSPEPAPSQDIEEKKGLFDMFG